VGRAVLSLIAGPLVRWLCVGSDGLCTQYSLVVVSV